MTAIRRGIWTSIGLIICTISFSQEINPSNLEDNNSGMNQDSLLTELETRIALLEHKDEKYSRLSISGYIQAQWQKADTLGVINPTFGNFPATTDNRFMIRRGRFKASYNYNDEEGINLTNITFQIDVTQNGFAVKDIFGKVTDPWVKWFGFKGGVYNRPFGYEIAYSSSERETPERSRFTTTLFPGERDMGASFIIAAPKTHKWSGLSFEAGLFNGTTGAAAEFDKKKDFISQIQLSRTNISETFKWQAGLSYYNGGNKYSNKYKFDLIENIDGVKKWSIIDSTDNNINTFVKREFLGVNGLISLDTKIGITTIRGEVVSGIQGGAVNSSTTPNALPAGNQYERRIFGTYLYLIQNLFNTKHNLVFKYDIYDPNTEVETNDIGKAGSNLTATDIKYTTFGVGYMYAFDHTWKLTVYKDFIKNEKTSLTGFTKDLKDNVLTIRVQYRFSNN